MVLLKSTDKQILPKTKAILQELAKRGVVIVLASGRPTAGLYAEANELELDKTGGYLLSFNGAKVVDYKTKEIIYQKCTMLKRHIRFMSERNSIIWR